MPPEWLSAHYRMVARAIVEGRTVPFLGAGVNLCGRPPDQPWRQGHHLPSGAELAQYLARTYGYPPEEICDLVRVSQYVAVMTGSGPLYDELRRVLNADYPPTALHQLLAGLPALLRAKGHPPRACHQLIVTTNYDDMLERAFRAVDQTFDLVTYIADGDDRGKFLHTPPAGDPRVIERPNEYRDLSLDRGPVVLKIHGAVDRENPDRDSYVITEDHYIDYLTRTELSSLVPVQLAAHLKKSHFLFLGYSLRDWNLRVILHRIWGQQRLTYKSWAIQFDPTPVDQEFWHKRDVEILKLRLEEYVLGLQAELDALPVVATARTD
jgi:SIR2-like protein